MSADKTNCFGKSLNSPSCPDCRYRESCSYYAATAPGLERGLNLTSLNCISDCCGSLLDPAPAPDEVMEDIKNDERLFSLSELADFLRYLMELDNYTLEILREIIAPVSGKKCTVADLCKLHHVSRQSMHRKLFRVIFKRPELRQMLRTTLDRLPPRQTV